MAMSAFGVEDSRQTVEKAAYSRMLVSKRDYSAAERRKLADKGEAMPDGSYPIKDAADLRNALHLWGHASQGQKRFIRKRAKQLGVHLPGKYGTGGSGDGAVEKAAGSASQTKKRPKRKPFQQGTTGQEIGRYALGAGFPVVHPLVAGKKGKKLRATGNEFGLAALGGISGTAIGGPRGARVGGLAGGATGTYLNEKHHNLKRLN